MTESTITTAFKQQFGRPPAIVIQAPGRINLIGEHTDYNDGFVLPAAVNYYTWFAVAENATGLARFYSVNLEEAEEVPLGLMQRGEKVWADYLKGIYQQYRRLGMEPRGLDCAFGGNLPVGAGMSSSAALECGFALALEHLLGGEHDRPGLARLAQRSSHEFMGIPCGIMDQFACMLGKKDQFIRLDCRSLEYEYISLDLPGYAFVLLDSRVSHELADSAYATRVEECRIGVEMIQELYREVESLRDVTQDMLRIFENAMDPVILRRCRYVVEENERLLRACLALRNQDAAGLGALMFRTHQGLRDEYEVSCREVDLLVDFAARAPGVAGARVMGGGFGGCTLNLVKEANASDFVAAALQYYREQTDIEGRHYPVGLVDGASQL